jgi:arylsulfatase A-like enzyme
MPYSMDMAPSHLYRDEEIIDDLAGERAADVTLRYVDEAIRFVSARRTRPFFLYFSHTIPHPPLTLPAAARPPGRAIYEDAIEHMDRETARLLEALPENTLVFFSSDNGPMDRAGQTGGLRGRIRDAYEGGVRVPLIARWPGRIPAGRVVETPVIAYDIFPTLLAFAGGALPSDRVYDGQDIGPLLTGRGTVERKQPFFWVYLDRVTAIRDGRWKLHVAHREAVLPQPELYDLEDDPQESRPLDKPDVIRTLKAKIDQLQAEVPKVWRLDYPVRDPRKLPSGVRRK